MSTLMRGVIGVAVLVGLAAMTGGASVKPKTPVEVWCGGDDGLTLRLRCALEDGFRKFSYFTLSNGKKQGSLLVTIPTNVEWEKVGKRTRVIYSVELTSTEDRWLGSSKGSCWDSAFKQGAAQILKDAKIAAEKIH